jgi:hypothetical protein
MATTRLLAIAAASGKVGSVFLIGDTLTYWQVSVKAAESPAEAAAHAQSLINDFWPNVIVTEEPGDLQHKGTETLALIAAMARVAEDCGLLDVRVPRVQRFPNKYAEADALVLRYPELAPWKPVKRRFFQTEPRNTVLFEALALADFMLNNREQ